VGMTVVDASVAVKWLLPEQGEEEAITLLRNGERLIAPDLLHLEVVGSVLRHFREDRLTEAQVRDINAAWNGMLVTGAVVLQSNDEVFERAVAISITLRHPLKDCLYIALAERDGADLVTADKTLHQRGRKVHTKITLLGRAA